MARKKSESRRDNKSGQIVEDGKYFRARLEVGRDPKTGKPQYKTARCKTRAEAVAELERLIAERQEGVGEKVDRSNFGQFLDQWLENTIKVTRSHNTYRQYRWLANDHIKPHLGSKQTANISRADVQRVLSIKAKQQVSLRDKPDTDEPKTPEEKAAREKAKRERAEKAKGLPTLSSNTLRLIRAVLHAAFEEAKLHSLTRRNPAEDVELPRKTKATKTQFLTQDEVIKFVKALDRSDLSDLFSFMIATGTRIGEATGVRWQDIDLSTPSRPLVWIRGQLHRIGGKLEYRQGTKTNQERCLPLRKEFAERLQAKKLLDDPRDPDGIVFLNSEGRRIDPKHANDRLAELCRTAGVPTISAHKLRHTAASLMLAESGDLHAVQKALGHSQVALTADLYGHATAETLRPVMSKLDHLFDKSPING